MRAGHRQHPFARQHVLAQPLRARHIRQVAIKDGFHQRIAARNHVADHEQVRLQRQLGGIEAFDQLDALRFQLGAHRRIDIGIAAGDAMAGLLGQHRQAAHEGAADAKDMNMHGFPGRHEARRLGDSAPGARAAAAWPHIDGRPGRKPSIVPERRRPSLHRGTGGRLRAAPGVRSGIMGQ
ncbi:hypothetical protein D9M72_509870 [compost metagenome]